jgi:hypothetical protein
MGNFALDLRGVGATRTALGAPGKTPRSRRPLWIGRAEWNGSDDNLALIALAVGPQPIRVIQKYADPCVMAGLVPRLSGSSLGQAELELA